MNLILLIGTCAAALFFVDRLTRKHLKSQNMSDQQIWGSFLAGKGFEKNKALFLWHEIASSMKVSPGAMRPDDSLASYEPRGNGELTPFLDSLAAKAEKHAALLDQPIDLNKVVTVGQYIRSFHDAVGRPSKSNRNAVRL